MTMGLRGLPPGRGQEWPFEGHAGLRVHGRQCERLGSGYVGRKLRSGKTTKWAPTHASFSSELTTTRQRFARERAGSNDDLAAARKKVDAAVWQRDLAEREVAAYEKVNYRRYLVGIIRP